MAKYVSRLQLISEKIIKASFETPPPLKSYKLSCIDKFVTHAYCGTALFFPNKRHNASQLLENSLPKLLASYYPLTGRLIDNDAIVDFGDAGAPFSEVQIKGSMLEILKDSDIRSAQNNIVFPSGIPWCHSYRGSLLFARVSHFDCGGMALGVCMSHKVGDGATLCNFLSDWAAMTRQPGEKPNLEFPGASIFPPLDHHDQPIISLNEMEQYESKDQCITKRFAFDGSKISQLKAMVAAESGVKNPTRVEVVTALLYKCAVNASNMNSESLRPSSLVQFAGLRPLVVPPLAQNSVGNFTSYFTTVPACDERDLNLSRLVAELRKGKQELRHNYKLFLPRDEYIKSAAALLGLNNIADVYYFTSLCRQPFYHIDFGWGRPIRVGFAATRTTNYVVLVDDHTGNGVEAFVTLTEKDMSLFESDKHLLAFASLNP